MKSWINCLLSTQRVQPQRVQPQRVQMQRLRMRRVRHGELRGLDGPLGSSHPPSSRLVTGLDGPLVAGLGRSKGERTRYKRIATIQLRYLTPTPIDYAKTCLAPRMAKLGGHVDTHAAVVGRNLLPHVGSGGSPLPRSGGPATHQESPGR